VEEVLSTDARQKLEQEYQQKLNASVQQLVKEKKKLEEDQKLFEEKRRKENELFQQKLQQEKLRMEAELQSQIRKSLSQDFENEIRVLRESEKEKEEKLAVAQRKELEMLRREKEIQNRETELELTVAKKLLSEREELKQQLRKEEEQRLSVKEEEHQFKMKDLQLQLEEQKRLIEEMKRRAEQGSMQRQGEVQELLLEELLKDHFPFDLVNEVGKGLEGADCILSVRNHLGHDCGQIIFESKRTKTFSNLWIDKLKADMRTAGADVAILVTQTYPKELTCFGEKDGVWICSFGEVMALTTALRHTIINVADARRSEENKGEKMQLLYNYLTGVEFRGSIETIVESFLSMKNAISRERIQMEKMWKEREKQLEKVLLSTSGLYGSIKGIAGASIGNIALLEADMEDEEEPKLLK